MPKRVWGIFCIICGLIWATAAAAEWVALDQASPAAPSVQAVQSAPERTTVSIVLPGFETETVQIEGAAYAKIVLPGHVQMLRQGLPEFPVISRSLIIPDRGVVAFKVLAADYRDFPMEPPVPSKGDLPRTVDPASVPYTFDPRYSEGGVWPPEPVELGQPFILRDHRGVTAYVYPFQYDFGRGVLKVLKSMTLEIVTSGQGGVNVKERIARTGSDPQFERIYRRLFLNQPADKYTPIPRPGPMLIVADDAFVDPMAPFVAWKQQKGIPVEMITVSSVGGTAGGIQTAITNRYQSADGLTYVVLVGDIAQVPTNTGTEEGAKSDPMYGMVEGSDHYPDLFVSRISAQTSTQVQAQVAKFIRYEKSPDAGAAADWYHVACGIASNESGGTGLYDYERTDLLRDDLLGYTFTDVDQIYQGMGGSTAAIAAALNEGRSLINYIGHGSGTAWTSVYFGSSDVHALTNGWMHPWIVDVSCSNGAFSNSECFAEAWLRAGTVEQPTGAVATYSASTLASWVPPCVMQAEVIDLLVAETENTLGALYFSGGMKALDDYPPPGGEGVKLIEQYNIFGDCSLVVRTDAPADLAVAHNPILPLGVTSFAIDAPGAAGATACLWRDGVIHGTAVTDGAGHADITLDPPVTTVGEVTLTVTAYNHVPYIAAVLAIVPAAIHIDPMAIDANKTSDITVSVYESDGITPIEGIDVWAEGVNYVTTPVATDRDGIAILTVHYPYGPSLDIVGQDPAESYLLFTEPITVNALALSGPDLTVTTDIGLSDSFALNLPGSLIATAAEGPDTLYALLPDGTLLATTDTALVITPTELGEVTGMIGVPGYDLYTETFPIIEAYGQLTGTVATAKTPLGGVTVRGYDEGANLIFEAVTDASGAYDVGEDILVADYNLVVDHFGYLHYEALFFLNYGANVYDIELMPADSGVMTGTVTESGTGLPLEADVKVYRSDTQELYAQTASDPGDGSYTTPSLPYFDYRVVVNAYQHIPVTIEVTVDDVTIVKDFVLEQTIGDLLVIDDGSRFGQAPAKLDKDGAVLAEAYVHGTNRAAQDLVDDLIAVGYTVTLEVAGVSGPQAWENYDLVIVACGAGYSPVSDASFRGDIESYVAAGGHLLIEGGELGYVSGSYPGYPTFAANVLHIADWNHDSSGNLTVADPGHYVMSVPNTIAGPVTVSYSNYGDQDAVTVASDAALVGSWTSYPTDGSVVAFDPNPSPAGGQIVYFAFNYSAVASPARQELLHNAVNWLITPEVGDCGVSGHVQLQAMSDYSGVLIEAVPGGGSLVTDASGNYDLNGLYAGTYRLYASKAGWATVVADVTLGDGELLSGVDFYLAPAVTTELCQSPGLSIPDNNPAGITDSIPVALGKNVAAMEVFLDITHTYIGDLIVELESPSAMTVRLHDRTGGSADDIYGWYPVELPSAESLDVLIGEGADGEWVLSVSDHAGSDLGTLNQWCLRVTYGDDLSGVGAGEDMPLIVDLSGNYPNPFNPRTKIVFSLPRVAKAELVIFDLKGRRVVRLVDGVLPAGRHEVLWDGLDALGRTASSGTYICRLKTGDFVATQKMTLMK